MINLIKHTLMRRTAANRKAVLPALGRKSARGFSLIEILVGLLIGMIAMIVVLQVFSQSESRKRTTSGTHDSLMTGAIGLYTLESDFRHSGYAITSLNMLGCTLQLRAGITISNLAPITINHPSIPAGDTNTDTLLIVYGQTNVPTEGIRVNSQTAANNYVLQAVSGFKANDLVIAAPSQTPSAPCVTPTLVLDTVTGVNSGANSVSVTTGLAGMSGNNLYTVGNSSVVGQNFAVFAYAVRKGTLTRCDYMVNDCGNTANATDSAIWVPIAGNVVSLRAQYAQDTSAVGAMTGTLGQYDQATPTTACGWIRAIAIRFALVSRSGQYDKSTSPYATTNAPTWDGSTAGNPAGSTAAPIDLSGTNANIAVGTWQNYRYKVFQAVVPIRNVNWMRTTPGGVANPC
jgi:type IV pilus assembly protein PilW